MRLSCQKALLLLIATIACDNSNGPPPFPPITYILDNIDGRPLPTFSSPIPEAGTVVSGALLLGKSDDAIIIQRRLQKGIDVTDTTNYTYQIDGSTIAFDYNPPCPINALCAAPPKGTLVSSRIDLNMAGSGGPLYSFRFYAPD